MKSFFSNMLAKLTGAQNHGHVLERRQARLGIESLEGRTLMSALPLAILPPSELSQSVISVASSKIASGTATTVTLTVNGSAKADGGLLVPAYAYPTTGGVWDQLASAAKSVAIEAILNPNSGPGSGVDRSYVAAVNKLHAAGGSVIGYVHTSYGTRSLATVQTEIMDYKNWYHVDGIFIDEMSSDASQAHLAYYQQIYNYVHSVQSGWTVVGNPGVTPAQGYAATADTLVVYEDITGYNSATPPAWQASYPAQKFANLVLNVNSTAAMQADVTLATTRNAGWVYITNATLPNPYGALPSYWSQLVSAVAANPSFTVNFGVTGGQSSGSFGPVTNHGHGVFTATLTGTMAGTASSITARIDNQLVTSHSPTITVTPGVAAKLEFVQVPAVEPRNQVVPVIVQVTDAYGNAVVVGNFSMTLFITSGTKLIGAITSVTNPGGRAVFEVSFGPGSYTLEVEGLFTPAICNVQVN